MYVNKNLLSTQCQAATKYEENYSMHCLSPQDLLCIICNLPIPKPGNIKCRIPAYALFEKYRMVPRCASKITTYTTFLRRQMKHIVKSL